MVGVWPLAQTITSRVTFRHCPEYHVEYQQLSGQFHVHCKVEVWNKSVLKSMYKTFIELRGFAKSLGYREMVSVSPNPKFCELFLAESIGQQKGHEVMVWDLK